MGSQQLWHQDEARRLPQVHVLFHCSEHPRLKHHAEGCWQTRVPSGTVKHCTALSVGDAYDILHLMIFGHQVPGSSLIWHVIRLQWPPS